MNNIRNISPIDGRYASKTKVLQDYFSEFSLIKYRVKVEIEYLIALSNLKELNFFLTKNQTEELRKIYIDFDIDDAKRIKEIEKETNHDVKSVEIFIREVFEKIKLSKYKEYIHFGLTSQDINNTAFPLMLKDFMFNHLFDSFNNLQNQIKEMTKKWSSITIIARTHGQPASPTKLGKEFLVFHERIHNQLEILKDIKMSCKFGGATGNLNAHVITFPKTNWIEFADNFTLKYLGLKRQKTTTQIDHYDTLSQIMHASLRINTILIDLCRDVWTYISMDFFKQKISEKEVGSSAMPHKVNPIDFENAEGNLGISNSLLNFLSEKLPISRLQRDLTDSTVIRNLGVPYAHIFIAIQSIQRGLNKLLVNENKINDDIENNWAVVAEAIQNILRRERFENPYNVLKDLTRKNKKINKEDLHNFIDSLNINDEVKKELKSITPYNYTGTA